ncbi:MAG TPA: aldehyde dehydrogenase family protein [Polyangiaceae bacterium]|nr:aldehyde dehydrogenase family protein [Polyangiaceae bacterium]
MERAGRDPSAQPLTQVPAGTPVVVGSRVVPMPALRPGDRVLAVGRVESLVVVSAEAQAAAVEAVAEAEGAVAALAACSPAQVSAFFVGFAESLADEEVWAAIAAANEADVKSADSRGRSTTRLKVGPKMRAAMIDGLRGWAATAPRVGEVIERRRGEGFVIERRAAPLGVVAFVFEGRPNVFADGAGVVRNGNCAVMRIGGDALDTALAIEERALRPALEAAGLPKGAVRLLRSREHAAGQALFTLPAVRLAVARGSGSTVALLGSIAEQHGIPASLHGTGGAWIYVEPGASPAAVENAIRNSLDRKVCNTLNVLVLDEAARDALGPVCERALRGLGAKVHVAPGAEGVVTGEPLAIEGLGTEWEWESTPELAFVTARGIDAAAALANRYSPHFVASIVSPRPGAFEEFYAKVDAPYVGNAFTRWVDGQWAWGRPELGLTNWERGRLLGRSGFLSGDDIVTVRDVFLDETGQAPQRR